MAKRRTAGRPEIFKSARKRIRWAMRPVDGFCPFVIPAIFKRESTPRLLDARLKIAGMTGWNGR